MSDDWAPTEALRLDLRPLVAGLVCQNCGHPLGKRGEAKLVFWTRLGEDPTVTDAWVAHADCATQAAPERRADL